MTTIDLDALEAVAVDAALVTTGNGWIADSGGIVLDPDQEGNSWDGTIVCEVPSTERLRRKWHLRDHIAAFDPPTALALIARLREAEAVIKDIAALHIKRERPSLIDCSHGPELTACRTRMIVAAYKPTTESGSER